MLRQELEKVSVEWTGQTVSITASIGIATADPGELESKALVGRADDAFYRAKRAGRNRVCVSMARTTAMRQQRRLRVKNP